MALIFHSFNVNSAYDRIRLKWFAAISLLFWRLIWFILGPSIHHVWGKMPTLSMRWQTIDRWRVGLPAVFVMMDLDAYSRWNQIVLW